jgi:hypothetical protein
MTVDLALHGSVPTRWATKWKDQAAFEDFIVKQLTHACWSTRRKKTTCACFQSHKSLATL